MTHWPANTLRELVSFLSTQHPGGLSATAIGKVCNVTPQTISQRFLRDDTDLSVVEEMARAYGFELELTFSKKAKGLTVLPRKQYPNAGNLQGLVGILSREQVGIRAVSERIGVDYSAVARAFNRGKIKISLLKRNRRRIRNRNGVEMEAYYSLGFSDTQYTVSH